MTREELIEVPAGTRLSIEEWNALPEDVLGELVDGSLEEEEVPDFLHEVLVMLLGQVLANWVHPRGGGGGGSGGSSRSHPTVGASPT